MRIFSITLNEKKFSLNFFEVGDKHGRNKQLEIWIEKYRRNKTIFHERNKPKWIDD